MIRVLKAAEEYLPRILEIMRDAISPIWTESALLSEMQKAESYFIVAIDEKTVVGFAVVRPVGDDGELLQIAVDKSVRRSGVGDLLMTAVLEYASINTLKSTLLEVRKGNEAAVRLYEKHGFKALRIRKDYYNDPIEDALIMQHET